MFSNVTNRGKETKRWSYVKTEYRVQAMTPVFIFCELLLPHLSCSAPQPNASTARLTYTLDMYGLYVIADRYVCSEALQTNGIEVHLDMQRKEKFFVGDFRLKFFLNLSHSLPPSAT